MSNYIDILRECFNEINEINVYIQLNIADRKNKYLLLYLVMRCCGAIEYIFKHIIFDSIVDGQNHKIVNYFENHILKNPTNPTYEKMCELISKIDEEWLKAFKNKFEKNDMAIQKLNSLVKNRNRFAHGILSSIPSASETKDHFVAACSVLKRLQDSLSDI